MNTIVPRPTDGCRYADGAESSPTGPRVIMHHANASWLGPPSGSTPRRASGGSRERRTESTGSGGRAGDDAAYRICAPRHHRGNDRGPFERCAGTCAETGRRSRSRHLADPCRSRPVRILGSSGSTRDGKERRGQHARPGPTAWRVAGDHPVGPPTVPADLTDRPEGGTRFAPCPRPPSVR